MEIDYLINLSLEENEISKFSPEDEMKFLRLSLVDEKHLSVSRGLICSICSYIVFDPVDCDTCNKLICRGCVKNPCHSTQCQQENFKNSCRTLKNMLSKISLKCPHYALGCQEVIEYENLQNHLNKNCKYFIYKCNYCNFSGDQDECAAHSINCQASFYKCSICEEKVKKKEKLNHASLDCLENICKLNLFLNLDKKCMLLEHDRNSKKMENEETIKKYFGNNFRVSENEFFKVTEKLELW